MLARKTNLDKTILDEQMGENNVDETFLREAKKGEPMGAGGTNVATRRGRWGNQCVNLG